MIRYSIAIILGSVLFTSLVVSCGDENPVIQEMRKAPPSYKSLAEKDDVLFNLQLLYPLFDWVEYNRVLDDDLIFFFSEDDIANGSPFTEFEKSDEIRILRHMADPSRHDAVLSIELTLSYSEEEWTPITPEDQKYAGETWYQKTVVYNMIVQAVPDMTFVCTDVNARVTIREGEDYSGKKMWRIIRWRDGITDGLLRTPVEGHAFSKRSSTWGGIKAVYR